MYIGNLDLNVTEEELRQHSLHFEEIDYVKIPVSKGCGFVQFAAWPSAEEAIQKLPRTMIGQQVVRVLWGRSLLHGISKWILINGNGRVRLRWLCIWCCSGFILDPCTHTMHMVRMV